MYQLGMPVFTDDVEWYCKDLSEASNTHAPNTPTTTSSPLSNEELQAIERSEAHWTGNFRQTPFSPDHPCYHEACFHCHHLGHIRINCQFYICPSCLCNAPNHIQNWCPLCHHLNLAYTTSSSSSSSNQSNLSIGSIHPIPPLLADQLLSLPPHHTFWGSCCGRSTTAHIHTSTILFCGVWLSTPGTDDDDVYSTEVWSNINRD